jgi:hypothetical protein
MANSKDKSPNVEFSGGFAIGSNSIALGKGSRVGHIIQSAPVLSTSQLREVAREIRTLSDDLPIELKPGVRGTLDAIDTELNKPSPNNSSIQPMLKAIMAICESASGNVIGGLIISLLHGAGLHQ